MKYLTVAKVLEIHEYAIAQTGGEPGVRDQGLLDSAVAQPRVGFSGRDLYPSIAEKAAALGFSLVMNHPFFDGNKRTGYAAMRMFLSRNDYMVIASIDERESIFKSLAASELTRDQFVAWVRDRIVRKGSGRSRRPDRPHEGQSEP
jgi:death-on-curing protein